MLNVLGRCAQRSGCQRAAFVRFNARYYATETNVPPSGLPPPPPSPLPDTLPSQPRRLYTRPITQRDLPPLQSNIPLFLALGALGLSGWGVFLLFATNSEKLSSSVTRQVVENIRANDELRDVLGDAVRPEPTWYMNGEPYISGAINTLQGHIDLSFRVKGHKQGGTLYFTSIRKAKGQPFTILRFRIVADDGTVVNVPIS